MTASTPPQVQSIWVARHPGWQGQQASTGGLVVTAAFVAVAAIAYGAILFSDPAPAMKVMGAAAIAITAAALWLLAAHISVSRQRVLRATVSGDSVRFGAATTIVWPLRALGVLGLILLAAWVWALVSVPASRLSVVTLLLVPVVAVALAYGGGGAWVRRPGSHALTLTPDRLVLRIPRNGLDVAWDEVQSAELHQNRVVVRCADDRSVSWAVRDLASDPVVLADLVTLYAQTPAARAEIGADTLQRLRDGAVPVDR